MPKRVKALLLSRYRNYKNALHRLLLLETIFEVFCYVTSLQRNVNILAI